MRKDFEVSALFWVGRDLKHRTLWVMVSVLWDFQDHWAKWAEAASYLQALSGHHQPHGAAQEARGLRDQPADGELQGRDPGEPRWNLWCALPGGAGYALLMPMPPLFVKYLIGFFLFCQSNAYYCREFRKYREMRIEIIITILHHPKVTTVNFRVCPSGLSSVCSHIYNFFLVYASIFILFPLRWYRGIN